MSSCTTRTAELPLSSPDTNPEEKPEIPIILKIVMFY